MLKQNKYIFKSAKKSKKLGECSSTQKWRKIKNADQPQKAP